MGPAFQALVVGIISPLATLRRHDCVATFKRSLGGVRHE